MPTAEVKQETALALSPSQIIQVLIEKGKDLDVEKLAGLMELQFKWEREQARKAWIAALQAFKSNPPELEKTKQVSYKNKDGSVTSYRHAELDVVAHIIAPELRKYGLTATWKTSSDSTGRIVVTCVLQHEDGHTEEVATLSGPADTSGGKNNIQAIGSTTTYLSRYTLFAGLGLVAEGTDDDGRGGEGMTQKAIDEYLITIKDAMNGNDLMDAFKAAYRAAQALNDQNATNQFIQAKDKRKTEIRG